MALRPKLLIIDMDNTLCDTYHTLSTRQWERVAQAFDDAGKPMIAKGFRESFGEQGFVPTMRKLKLTPAEQRFALRVYDKTPVKGLALYDDAHALLRVDIPKVLVSRGNRNLQLKKIRTLGIRPHFQKVLLVPTLKRKEDAFAKIIKSYRLKPQEMLIIGDRVEDEIADGTKLGIPTALVRRPDWKVHKGVAPTVTVHSLRTLAKRLSTSKDL